MDLKLKTLKLLQKNKSKNNLLIFIKEEFKENKNDLICFLLEDCSVNLVFNFINCFYYLLLLFVIIN